VTTFQRWDQVDVTDLRNTALRGIRTIRLKYKMV